MAYSTGNFTVDEIGFIQIATVRVLTAVARGELDLNLLAREELASRGMNREGVWVGFGRATKELAEERQKMEREKVNG